MVLIPTSRKQLSPDESKHALKRKGQADPNAVVLFRNAIMLLAIIILTATVGFHYFEGWSYLNALYFTVIYITTIGLGDLYPVTPGGRIFAVSIALSGVGLVAYSIGQFSRIMVDLQFQKILGRRKLEKSIKNLKDHYLLCGYGHVGSLIARELHQGKIPFVVIEKLAEVIPRIRDEKFLFLHGDATDDNILLEAGIKQAKGLVTTSRADAENVYIVLTAKALNADIHLISLANDERSADKLRRAGANLVVSPFEIGGRRIVQGIVRPSVMNFIDLAVYDSNLELQMEQIPIQKGSHLINSSLLDQAIRQKFDVIILGIATQEGEMHFNPNPNYLIKEGDTLIALGKRSDMQRMSQTIGS